MARSTNTTLEIAMTIYTIMKVGTVMIVVCFMEMLTMWNVIVKDVPDVADNFSAVAARLKEHNIIKELQIRREDATIVLYGRWLNHPNANTSLQLRKT